MSDDFISNDEADVFDPVVAERAQLEAKDLKTEYASAVSAHLQRSKQAYERVFKQGNATADDVEFVMKDLAWFCKAYDAQWSDDPRQQDRNVARREVFQRIMEYTSLDTVTLQKKYIQTQTA